MSASEDQPVTVRLVGLVVGAVMVASGAIAAFQNLAARVADKADQDEVTAIHREVSDIKALLCNKEENRDTVQCRRTRADYR